MRAPTRQQQIRARLVARTNDSDQLKFNVPHAAGIVCAAAAALKVFGAIVSYARIAYFKQTVASKSRFHISLGHETVMARCPRLQCNKA